jgi:iron complex outermembrane receptor protein
MSDRWISRLLLVAAVAIVVVFAVPALAQEAEEATDEGQMTEEEKAIEEALKRQPFAGEITVTSRRREEQLQEIPIAVSVISGDNLEDITATDISEMQQFVPNLAIYQGRNQSTTMTAFIRGIGQADPLWGVDPGVGLYIDDVYFARPQGALLDVYDVERVEVLRGPQGTLYGKNTIGGAMKYVTKPLSDTPEGRITWNPGTYNTQELRASIGGALIPGKLRGKASFAWLTREGYGENLYQGHEVSDKDTMAYRLGLEWLPTENLRVRFDYDHLEDNAHPKGLTRMAPNFFCPIFLAEECPPLDNLFDTESGIEPLNETTVDGLSMTWTWDINPNWQFKSITARREGDSTNYIDFDTTPARIADSLPTYFDEQTTQEFQLVFTGGGKWSGVMGAYYFDGKAGGTVNFVFVESVPGTTDGDMKTRQYAFYGDAVYQINDRWAINFGLRPTREEKTGRAYNYYTTDDTFETPSFILADFEDTVTFTSWAPKIGVDWRVSEDVMVYGKVNQGFKSGGYNVRANTFYVPESAEPFDDEVMTMAEIGVKSVIANNSLVLNGAAFYGNYTDVQVSYFTAYDSNFDGEDDAFFGDIRNEGDATVKGLELEYNWASRGWFGLSGFLAYLDATPDTLIDGNGNGLPDTQVISNAPELTGTIRANFDWPLFGGLLTASAGYAYRDDAVLTNEEFPITQDAYGLLDAWIMWLSGNAKWRFGISGKNLTDEEYLLTGYTIPTLGVLQGSYGPPRQFIATLEFRFF